MPILLLILIVAIPAYFLGSLNGAIIASRIFYRKDIRKFGSGNPGLTNFLRVFGKGGALLVILVDVLKTLAPVVFAGYMFARFTDMALSESWLLSYYFDVSLFGMLVAGLFAVLGHCFPVLYGFKGGKAVLTIGTLVFAVD
jgi:glycerol-3-phosphate acyltransferase PlsY